MDPEWLDWARRLQSIAQAGLTYAKDPHDVERYVAVRQIAAEMMAAGSGMEALSFVEVFTRELGYATPKIDVRAAVFQNDRLLLVKQHVDGGWTLPGGWADVGDTPSEAAIREVKEESGYDVTARKLVAVYDRNLHGHPPIPYHAYKMFFLCDIAGGRAQAGCETDAVDFFEKDHIPPLSLSRVTPSQIAHIFEHYRHPEWPTSFD